MRKFTAFLILITIILSSCANVPENVKQELESCKMTKDYGECEIDVSIKYNALSACKYAKTNQYRKICEFIIKKEFEKCAEVKNFEYETTNEFKEQSPVQASEANDYCYNLAAKISGNEKYCEETNSYAYNCLLNQFPEKFNVETECQKIESPYDRNYCYYESAQKLLDVNSCLFIESQQKKDTCITLIIQTTKNVEDCELINDKTLSYYIACKNIK
jgi:hypothetical protein